MTELSVPCSDFNSDKILSSTIGSAFKSFCNSTVFSMHSSLKYARGRPEPLVLLWKQTRDSMFASIDFIALNNSCICGSFRPLSQSQTILATMPNPSVTIAPVIIASFKIMSFYDQDVHPSKIQESQYMEYPQSRSSQVYIF